MSKTTMKNAVDVLIVGAGPTGLTAAAEARRFGMSVRIVDRKPARSTHDSRALVVHSRPMEILHALGDGRVCDNLLDVAYKVESLNFYFGPRQATERRTCQFDDMIWGDARFPFMTMLPQFDTERVLQEEFESRGGTVEWNTSLNAISQSDESVDATLTLPDGTEECVSSSYLLGCDGGRSKTRDLVGLGMSRAKSKVYFIVGDVCLGTNPFDDSKGFRVFYASDGPLAILPLTEDNCYRVIALAPEGVEKESDITLDNKFFNDLILQRTGVSIDCRGEGWRTIFEITHGIADSFRKGRVFLAGDAAHVHSPVGGQGMNYGILDSTNLIWKLAWVQRCNGQTSNNAAAIATILDSYDLERRTQGNQLLRGTELATYVITSRNWFLASVRNFLAKLFLTTVFRYKIRTLAELDLDYSSSSSTIIPDSCSGNFICQPGQRLPNLRLVNVSGERLIEKIDRVRHTWVVLRSKATAEENGAASNAHGIGVVHVTPCDEQDPRPRINSYALKAPQAILVRPDLYVAAVGPSVEEVWEGMVQMFGGCGSLLEATM